MWLVEVVSVNKQLSVLKKFCFKYMISMIKAKLSFFWTSNSEGHGFHGNKGAILFSSSVIFQYQQNFILLKLVEYIESYRYLSALCWKLWIQIFSTEKTP